MTVPELSTQDLLPTLRPQSCLCFVHTDRWGGVTMLVTLIQLGESPWLEFPGSIPAVGKDVRDSYPVGDPVSTGKKPCRAQQEFKAQALPTRLASRLAVRLEVVQSWRSKLSIPRDVCFKCPLRNTPPAHLPLCLTTEKHTCHRSHVTMHQCLSCCQSLTYLHTPLPSRKPHNPAPGSAPAARADCLLPVWNVDSHPQHLLWKLFLVVALGALEEVLC